MVFLLSGGRSGVPEAEGLAQQEARGARMPGGGGAAHPDGDEAGEAEAVAETRGRVVLLGPAVRYDCRVVALFLAGFLQEAAHEGGQGWRLSEACGAAICRGDVQGARERAEGLGEPRVLGGVDHLAQDSLEGR